MDKQHEHWIKQTIKLASKAKGLTSPNPLVGCVILDKEGNKISEGFHKKAGTDHAEAEAIKRAKKTESQLLSGGTLYVNLEPCCHYGRTPPCTKAIIEAGIKKVVIGSVDPNEKVAGQGIKELKSAGIEVLDGVLKDECDELNKFFFYWIKYKRPWVTLKIAATLDGYINLGKHGKKITGDEVQKFVHQMRSEYDAVLTGSGTVIADNPILTVRKVKGRNPVRVVLDRTLNCSPESNVFNQDSKNFLFTKKHDSNRQELFQNTEIVQFSGNLIDVLEELGKRDILSVMVEAGCKINTSFIEEDLFNDVFYFINPRLYGKPDSKKIDIYNGNLIDLKINKPIVIGEDLLVKMS